MFGAGLMSIDSCNSPHEEPGPKDKTAEHGLDFLQVQAYRLGDCDWPEHPAVRASFVDLHLAITVLT